MGSIKAEKSKAMNKYRKNHFVIHNLLHLVAGVLLTCSLYFSIIPSLCSTMEQFFLISLPSICSFFFNPKCLFIVVNVIVIFLVGESGFVGSKTSPARDVYDEYIERSRSRLRRASVSTSVPQEVGNEDEKMDCEEENEECGEMKEEKELFEVIACEDKSIEEGITCEIGEEYEREIDEEKVVELPADEEKVVELAADEREEKVVELAAEELNKRVEDFIARVNKQRWMEAQLLSLEI